MCMKNINTNITFFENVQNKADDDDFLNISSVPKKFPKIKAVDLNSNSLEIEELSFLYSVNAIEKTDDNGNPIHDNGEEASNTIFFAEQYEVCFRITETSSGRFIDLENFTFRADEKHIKLCRKIYNDMMVCKYQHVGVERPPEGKNMCVLKVLIRHIPAGVESDSIKWIVQSIHPIILDF